MSFKTRTEIDPLPPRISSKKLSQTKNAGAPRDRLFIPADEDVFLDVFIRTPLPAP